jgi:hypothetical protein
VARFQLWACAYAVTKFRTEACCLLSAFSDAACGYQSLPVADIRPYRWRISALTARGYQSLLLVDISPYRSRISALTVRGYHSLPLRDISSYRSWISVLTACGYQFLPLVDINSYRLRISVSTARGYQFLPLAELPSAPPAAPPSSCVFKLLIHSPIAFVWHGGVLSAHFTFLLINGDISTDL